MSTAPCPAPSRAASRERLRGRRWRFLGSVFFFQAEDGIRAGRVTGVQTCALPILLADSLIPQSASAVLDPTRITTGEPDRDRSLESPDFFDAAKFPHWTFASTRIVPKGPASFEMDGDLTIHGVTQPERLDVTVSGEAAHPEYRAKGEIDRHAFGMIRTRLDPTIGDTVDITLDIVLE